VGFCLDGTSNPPKALKLETWYLALRLLHIWMQQIVQRGFFKFVRDELHSLRGWTQNNIAWSESYFLGVWWKWSSLKLNLIWDLFYKNNWFKVHIHFLEVFTDSVTVYKTVNMFFLRNLYRFFSVKSVHNCFDFKLGTRHQNKFRENQRATLQNQNKLSSPPQLKINTNVYTLHRKTVNSYRKKCGSCVKQNVNSHRICKYLQKKTYVYMVL